MVRTCVSRKPPVPSYLIETLVGRLFELAGSGLFTVNYQASTALVTAHLARLTALAASVPPDSEGVCCVVHTFVFCATVPVCLCSTFQMFSVPEPLLSPPPPVPRPPVHARVPTCTGAASLLSPGVGRLGNASALAQREAAIMSTAPQAAAAPSAQGHAEAQGRDAQEEEEEPPLCSQRELLPGSYMPLFLRLLSCVCGQGGSKEHRRDLQQMVFTHLFQVRGTEGSGAGQAGGAQGSQVASVQSQTPASASTALPGTAVVSVASGGGGAGGAGLVAGAGVAVSDASGDAAPGAGVVVDTTSRESSRESSDKPGVLVVDAGVIVSTSAPEAAAGVVSPTGSPPEAKEGKDSKGSGGSGSGSGTQSQAQS